jgi:hypothetical protein
VTAASRSGWTGSSSPIFPTCARVRRPLKIDRFTIDLNNLGVARKWYDNVVAATSYIGPMAMSQPLTAPTGLRVVR